MGWFDAGIDGFRLRKRELKKDMSKTLKFQKMKEVWLDGQIV